MFLLGFTVAGCGGDDETTVTETVAEQETTETTSSTETAEPTTEAPPPAKRGPGHFRTPSSNVGCVIAPSIARCDIRERNWDPTPSSAPCDLDYGQGISLDAEGFAQFVCAGDTTLGGPATLGYGESAQRGTLRCDSARAGVTCTEARSGHGFFLSRESFRIF